MRPYITEMTKTNYMCQEKKEEEVSPALDSVDTLIRRFEDYIEKSKERQITATRNNTNHTKISTTTITWKQKGEEK